MRGTSEGGLSRKRPPVTSEKGKSGHVLGHSPSYLCYLDGCRDLDCKAAWSDYQKRWKHKRRLGPAYIDATGTRRRVQALARLGWHRGLLAKELNRSVNTIKKLYTATLVSRETAEMIRAVYDRLSMTLPPSNRGTSLARAKAEAKGWPPPLAWDEENIDDPAALPSGIKRDGYCRRGVHEMTPDNTYIPPSEPRHVYCRACRNTTRQRRSRAA